MIYTYILHIYLYIIENYSVIKNEINAICSNVDGPRDYYTKWNISKTNIIWHNLYVKSKKRYKWTCLQNRNRLTDIKNKLIVTKEEGVGDGGEIN